MSEQDYHEFDAKAEQSLDDLFDWIEYQCGFTKPLLLLMLAGPNIYLVCNSARGFWLN